MTITPKMRYFWRTRAGAFTLGFLDMLRDEFGRTNEDYFAWNEAYDHGGNVAEFFLARRKEK